MIESISQFLKMLTSDDEKSQLALRSEEASEIVWWQILESHPEHVRTVSLNKTLPHAILSRLAIHPCANVRADIANRRSLPHELFLMLASDKDESVRARVAWNKKTPMKILKILASDLEEIVFEPARARLEK